MCALAVWGVQEAATSCMILKGSKSSAERPVIEAVNYGLSLQSSLSGSLCQAPGRSSYREGEEKSAFRGARSGLILDMLRMVLLKISGDDLVKSGKQSAIHSFNGVVLSEGAAPLNPVENKRVYKSPMAVMSPVGDQETKHSSGVIGFRSEALNTVNSTLVPVNPFSGGRIIEDRKMYRQTFVIRSYEVGSDRTASIETLTNLFQEVALNHVWLSGIGSDGFGTTKAMMHNNLIWVVNRMHVEIERYPAWYFYQLEICRHVEEIRGASFVNGDLEGDVVVIDSWVAGSGKNGMRRDWVVRDFNSSQVLARSTSTWVMMHQMTRRLSKMPDDVKSEISPFFLDRFALPDETPVAIPKLDDSAQHIISGFTPRRSDLDMNQHVNNVKYINWMMESVPSSLLETHELTSVSLQYRRECRASDIIQSLATPDNLAMPGEVKDLNMEVDKQWRYSCAERSLLVAFSSNPTWWINHEPLHLFHLLRTQKDATEIVRGQSTWRLKRCTAQ